MTTRRILLLAPHPFFENRGTPIDVEVLVRSLCERPDTYVDLVVYPMGEEVHHQHLTIHRVANWFNFKRVRPGFSVKKLVLDVAMLIRCWRLMKSQDYEIIHADEESVFIAMLMKRLFKTPYIYDIDSSIAQQMVEKMPRLKFLARTFNWLEGRAIKGAMACAPVCNALADLCHRDGAKHVVTLHDISQLAEPDRPKTHLLNQEIGSDRLLLIYIGNLESYQGVDLLVESMQYVLRKCQLVDLVIIGGEDEDIQRLTSKAEQEGSASHVHFIGKRPFNELDKYLAEADILVAPRIRGINTPMKVFPYMHSRKPVLLTKLPTHTQLLSEQEAYLAEPNPTAFAEAIITLAEDPELRQRLADGGREFVEKNHLYDSHQRRVNQLYDWIEQNLTHAN